MKKISILIIIMFSITSLTAMTEKQKINMLLDRIESSDCIFIRNGVRHNSKAAREHLELKLSKAGGRIKTARQFIKYLASKSSWTGRPYCVEMKNGTKYKAADWLTMQLKDIEKSE